MAETRRQFLTRLAQGAAMACAGGTLWGYLLSQQAKASPGAIRPPGALPEADFNAACIKCGQCVVACPYDTLRLAAPGEQGVIGTPVFTPRDVPCYMCPDIPCMKACPTEALTEDLQKIEDARMGLAVIDIENCLSWKGLRCEICYRDCPIKGTAITVEVNPRKISKHAFFVPLVHSDACTGCGICERACPTDEAAIRILPAKLVQGVIGEHYRLGWTFDTQITQDFKPAQRAPEIETDSSSPSGMDVLNSGEF